MPRQKSWADGHAVELLPAASRAHHRKICTGWAGGSATFPLRLQRKAVNPRAQLGGLGGAVTGVRGQRQLKSRGTPRQGAVSACQAASGSRGEAAKMEAYDETVQVLDPSRQFPFSSDSETATAPASSLTAASRCMRIRKLMQSVPSFLRETTYLTPASVIG